MVVRGSTGMLVAPFEPGGVVRRSVGGCPRFSFAPCPPVCAIARAREQRTEDRRGPARRESTGGRRASRTARLHDRRARARVGGRRRPRGPRTGRRRSRRWCRRGSDSRGHPRDLGPPGRARPSARAALHPGGLQPRRGTSASRPAAVRQGRRGGRHGPHGYRGPGRASGEGKADRGGRGGVRARRSEVSGRVGVASPTTRSSVHGRSSNGQPLRFLPGPGGARPKRRGVLAQGKVNDAGRVVTR